MFVFYALLALVFVGWQPVAGVMATPTGAASTPTVAVTVMVAVSITKTELEPKLAA